MVSRFTTRQKSQCLQSIQMRCIKKFKILPNIHSKNVYNRRVVEPNLYFFIAFGNIITEYSNCRQFTNPVHCISSLAYRPVSINVDPSYLVLFVMFLLLQNNTLQFEIA